MVRQAGAWRSSAAVYVAGLAVATAVGVFGLAVAPQYTALALVALVAAALFAWAVARRRGTLVLAAGALVLATGVGVRYLPGGYMTLRGASLLLAVAAVLGCGRAVLDRWARDGWLFLLVLLGAVSLVWSIDLGVSANSLAGFAGALLLGSVLATFDVRTGLRLIAGLFTGLAALSLLLRLVAPDPAVIDVIRPDGVDTMFIGVFGWNSELGAVAGIATVCALGLAVMGDGRWWWAAVALSGAAVLSADSATSTLATAAACVVVLLGSSWARLGAFVVATLTAAWLLLAERTLVDTVLAAVGRSADLTGRASIWEYSLEVAGQNLFVGRGIGAGALDFTERFAFTLDQAHNGYLQLLLDLGLAGVVLFLLSLQAVVARLARARRQPGVWALTGLLAFFLAQNLANNFILAAHVLVALYAWIAFSLDQSATQAARLKPVTAAERRASG